MVSLVAGLYCLGLYCLGLYCLGLYCLGLYAAYFAATLQQEAKSSEPTRTCHATLALTLIIATMATLQFFLPAVLHICVRPSGAQKVCHVGRLVLPTHAWRAAAVHTPPRPDRSRKHEYRRPRIG